MVLSLSYRRPDRVSRSRGSEGSIDSDLTDSDGASLKSMPITPKGIPEALSFDRIVNGGCCPPCTKREFLDYLKYVERAPENLQFFLWFKDYEKRFNELPQSEKVLAPEWTPALAEAERKKYRAMLKKNAPVSETAKDLFKGSDFEEKKEVIETKKDDVLPFDDRSSDEEKRNTMSTSDGSYRPTTGMKSMMSNHTAKAENAFEEAGLNRPFTVQPYRDEISRILTVYIIQDAPRQLNVSGGERHAILKALEYTTHPSAFREIINTVEYSLRRQAHPNFIRWAICNGNRPRVIFARGLGVFLIIAGIVTDILITLSRVGRGWRVLPIILLILGVSTLIAAWKGMCVVLHGLHHQHVRPWELFVDEDEIEGKLSSEYNPKTSISIDSLTSTSANSFEDEPWVAKYKRRNVVRQVFDREVWIREPALRQIQDTIFIQAMLGALLTGAIIVAIFVAVPSPRLL